MARWAAFHLQLAGGPPRAWDVRYFLKGEYIICLKNEDITIVFFLLLYEKELFGLDS